MSTNYKTNEGVIKAWLNCEAEAGHNARESIFFEGNTIYSYGHHFPLAHRTDADTIEITWGERYSATTSRHQSLVHHLAYQHFLNDRFNVKFIILIKEGEYAGGGETLLEGDYLEDANGRVDDLIVINSTASGV